MEKEGLVRKTKDLERKNLIRVSLTEKGQQAYYQSSRLESVHRIMSSLSEEERQQLSSCLETLRDRALKELGMEQRPPFP
jgi:DNA-binding MarR family transcriptional regulator